MICSLFNIMVIYFYETSLLLFTLNYRYILGSISHSFANAKIRFFYISKQSSMHHQSNIQHPIDNVLDKGMDLWNTVV